MRYFVLNSFLLLFLFIPFSYADLGNKNSISLENFRWIAPAAPGISEIPGLEPSNANIALALFQKKLYMAWRNAPSHFASSRTKILIASSTDLGEHWTPEKTIQTGNDLREPFLYSIGDTLFLTYAELGTNPTSFDPKQIWRVEFSEKTSWSEPIVWVDHPEMPWEIKFRQNKLWMTSYTGNHYKSGDSGIEVHFRNSIDGKNWVDVNPDRPVIYKGGVSEVGFEFDENEKLWAVTRNEDGDKTGFGSHLTSAESSDYSLWDFPKKSDPNRYDSPRMFNHEGEIYLIARRDIDGPYDMGLDFLSLSVRKPLYLAKYSLRAKRTALYQIDKTTRKVVWLMDLPGCGDTAFASIVELSKDRFLIGNYTSPLDYQENSWLSGQTSADGTQLYFVEIVFTKKVQ